MNKALRIAILAAGIGWALFLVLLVIAAVNDSLPLGALAGVLGFALGAALVGIAAKAMGVVRDRSRQITTRVNNLERREKTLSQQAEQNIGSLGELEGEVVQLRTELESPSKALVSIESDVADIRKLNLELLRTSFESALILGREPEDVISSDHARELFAHYLATGEVLRTRPLIEHFDLLGNQSLTTLRSIYRVLRAAGYWELARDVVTVIAERSGRENDARAVEKISHEVELFTHPTAVSPALPDGIAYDSEGPIIHMVGRVLPEMQTGYTLRTQYTASAQASRGLPIVIVGQSGITEPPVEQVQHYVHGGIDYYLLPGQVRRNQPLTAWLRDNIVELAKLVLELRPSILHAQSDFINGLIALAVGRKYGIPVLYESRGFWEESWLSRTINSHGWGSGAEHLFSMYGLPDAYTLRKGAEEVVRELSDHVFTLAEVMRDHILTSANGAIEPSQVSIVPNAVDPANFPVQEPDQELKDRIGLPPDAVVVGYISSIVEYEGIDTLLDAYHVASTMTETPMCLLLVGDGDYAPVLKKQVADKSIPNVFFTGRVPHEEVLSYYGLIDLFVVPRKPAAVADLVTPLKPFEAFSTGRAVVLSDVGALAEITRESGAVETFVAGSADDLSRRIAALVDDPDRRAQLSNRAATWVRNHRTWESNVSGYYQVYRKHGYRGPSTQVLGAELRLRERNVNPGDVIDALRRLEAPPLTGWFSLDSQKQSAQELLETGWIYAEFEPVKVAERPDWAEYGHRHRTWGFNLHTWKFMEALLREYENNEDRAWLDVCVDIALDWLDTYLGENPPEDPMAWYDMSLALRAPALLNVLTRASAHEDLRAETTILLDGLLRHIDELHQDRAFNPSNNHGFYTAAAQLHLAHFAQSLPGTATTGEEGLERMRTMAERQFAIDGVHLEHSPDYHRMLLGSFERAIEDGLIQDEDIRERIRRAAHVLGWMIQPDGCLVQFGDTPATRMVTKGAHSSDPETDFLMTRGSRGTPPSTEMAVFADGGYAFVRSPAPRSAGDIPKAGYLAFNAAFHSRAHKHADDLTVVWYDRGTEILVDAGRYGYGELLPADSPLRKKGFYYGTPERQYVESTQAHNTLALDGADQERRNRTPYGSGIVDGSHDGDSFDLIGRVHHPDYIHRRRLVYTPGRELRILDSVFSQTADVRSAVVWLNIHGGFELVEAGDKVVFELPTQHEPLRLEVKNPGELIEPVRGGTNPLRGWRSRHDRSLEPVWSIGFAVSIDTRASVTTVLQLNEPNPIIDDEPREGADSRSY